MRKELKIGFFTNPKTYPNGVVESLKQRGYSAQKVHTFEEMLQCVAVVLDSTVITEGQITNSNLQLLLIQLHQLHVGVLLLLQKDVSIDRFATILTSKVCEHDEGYLTLLSDNYFDDIHEAPKGSAWLAARIHRQLIGNNELSSYWNRKRYFPFSGTLPHNIYIDGIITHDGIKQLTTIESIVFTTLVRNRNSIVEFETLLNLIGKYGRSKSSLNSLFVHICSIRKKLRAVCQISCKIQVHRSVGYSFECIE